MMLPQTLVSARTLPLAAFLLSTTACGAEPNMGDAASPGAENMSNPSENFADPAAAIPADAIRASQGTVATIGDCRCGIALVATDHIVVATAAPGWPETRQKLAQGELLNACGALHRVLGFGADAASGRPGDSGRFVVIDRNPATTVKLEPGAVTLTLGGELGPLGPGNVILKELTISGPAQTLVAHFKVRYQGSDRAVEARAADLVELGPARHRLLAIRAADPTLGVPGWIEIENKAAN